MIVSFGGYAPTCQRAPREFSKFLEHHFPDQEVLYLGDTSCSTYHKGILGVSTSVDETTEYLRKETVGRSPLIFIGTSGGGYAAILFGSLLNVDHVIAFIPPTILYRDDKEPRYKNLRPLMNARTQYQLFADLSVKDPKDCHHVSHCENVCTGPNVTLVKKDRLDLKQMRDSGELFEIFQSILEINRTCLLK